MHPNCTQAKEKEEEIHVKTEEEYNIQKLNLIVASKVKIREEFKKKEEALSIKNRMFVLILLDPTISFSHCAILSGSETHSFYPASSGIRVAL